MSIDNQELKSELTRFGWEQSKHSSVGLTIYEKYGFEIRIDQVKLEVFKLQNNPNGGYYPASNLNVNMFSVNKTGNISKLVNLIEMFETYFS